MKKYILERFRYRELGDSFSVKIKKALKGLEIFPGAYQETGFVLRGYPVYMKSYKAYLIFYLVDEKNKRITVLHVLQEGMNWQFVIKRWLRDQIR